MKITVIGSGYVGLVAGTCFAETGNVVYCVDHDSRKIEMLKRGEIPIYEPGLSDLVKRNMAESRLYFTLDTAAAVKESEIIFLAVGTPGLPSGEHDLSFLKAASEEVARAMTGYRIIVNKSTVPIGTHKKVAEWMAPYTQHPLDVVSNPEFLKEGAAIDDFLKPDRVVIGTTQESVYQKMAELYAPFVRQGNPIHWMDPVSAEMTKYACNAFLATRISFMNELSLLCEKVGGDIESIRKGMSTDSRIGRHFLYAGAGYGGSCFPKDIHALVNTAQKNDVNLSVVMATEDANERQKKMLARKVKKHFGSNLSGKTFCIWGLAFKPNTDDMREAPSIPLIEELLESGAKVQAYDPVAHATAHEIFGNRITYSKFAFDALLNADALVIVTEWNEFRHPDFEKIKTTLKTPVIFDGRNVYNPKQMRELAFTYYCVGRT